MIPVTYDRWGYTIVALSPLRERRLLQMAQNTSGNHKQHYGEYCFLIYQGYVEWSLGTAFLSEAGKERLTLLLGDGV